MGGSRRTEKILSENVKLKRHLKVTRQNNAILRKKMSHLTLTNDDLKSRLEEIKADFTSGNAELTLMKQKFEKLKKNNTETYSVLESVRNEKKELMTSLQNVQKGGNQTLFRDLVEGDSEVGAFIMVTDLICWWYNHFLASFFVIVVIFPIYESVTNIENLSPTHLVSNIRHQHRFNLGKIFEFLSKNELSGRISVFVD